MGLWEKQIEKKLEAIRSREEAVVSTGEAHLNALAGWNNELLTDADITATFPTEVDGKKLLKTEQNEAVADIIPRVTKVLELMKLKVKDPEVEPK